MKQVLINWRHLLSTQALTIEHLHYRRTVYIYSVAEDSSNSGRTNLWLLTNIWTRTEFWLAWKCGKQPLAELSSVKAKVFKKQLFALFGNFSIKCFFSFSLKLHSISLPPFFLPLSSLSFAQLQQKLRTHAHFLFGTSAHLFHTLTHTDTHGHSILSRTPSPSPTVSLWKQTISAKPSCAHYTHTHARKNAQYAHFYPPATLPLQPSSTLFQKFPFSVLALTTKAFEYKNIRERVKAEVRKLEKAKLTRKKIKR